MTLYAIKGCFKPSKNSEYIEGTAICSDPDTPVTFITQDGLPVSAETIWDYNLYHLAPWGRFD